MNDYSQRIDTLNAQANRGDQKAAADLRQTLAPQMVYMVRRTLRLGHGSTALERRILAEARRLRANDPDCLSQEESLVWQIVQRLCHRVVRTPGQAALQTRCLGETVVV